MAIHGEKCGLTNETPAPGSQLVPVHSQYTSPMSIPANTVRLAVFQPTRRPRMMTSTLMENEFGSVTMTGQLGQRESDFYHAMLATALDCWIEGAGRLCVKVDLYRVARVLSDKPYSGALAKIHLDRLKSATLRWRSKQRRGFEGAGNIIADYDFAVEPGNGGPAGPFGGNRRIYLIKFGEKWSQSVLDDIPVLYDVAAVCRFKYGITQAVAKLMLSHRQGWRQTLDTVLDWLLVFERQNRRQAKRRLISEQRALCAVGIEFDGNVLITAKSGCTPLLNRIAQVGHWGLGNKLVIAPRLTSAQEEA